MNSYDESVGAARDMPAAYDEARWHDCERCQAKMHQWCTNPITGRRSALPCEVRLVTGASGVRAGS